jgi:pyruvate/2-oxoglutarate/acetoin dehydrogenase E1 component|tara:strand:+ start:11029 stop:12099 length:1071 start_codon:yes stop_codon:yes gene_type:complete
MTNRKRDIFFSKAINESLVLAMKKNKNVLLIGLGVDDPKGIFGTTVGINKIFKKDRVFDFPTAENAMTGIAIGSSLVGMRPVITHQRVEFSLLSLEQIINQAAKWCFMSAGKKSVPLVIRLIIGRGWGQGPQHSQSLESIFAHIPGLKIVCPSSPLNAKGLLTSSIEDNNPVIFFEHRWLHVMKGNVPKNYYKLPIGKASVLKKGKDITIVSSSYMVVECLRSSNILKNYSINVEIVDLQSLRPLDINTIMKSVRKTKKVLVVDNGMMNFGISAEIIAKIYENLKLNEQKKIILKRIGLLDAPIPSSRELAKYIYPNYLTICKTVGQLLNINLKNLKKYNKKVPSDQPNDKFMGPF